MTHSDLVNEILLYLAPLGLCWKNNSGALKDNQDRLVRYGLKGSTDILACIKGRFVAVEVKVGRDRLRPAQKTFAEAVARNNGVVILARSVEDVAVNLFAHGLIETPADA